MKTGGIQKYSLVDFPGRISAVLFSQGCNLRCPWCHNPQLVPADNPDALNWRHIIDFLHTRRGLLDGVVISGGEPLLQPGLDRDLAEICRLGFYIKIDTNGTLPNTLDTIISKKNVTSIAMDIKASEASYPEACGTYVDFRNIRKSISLIMASGLEYEFRTTVVPGIHTPEMIGQIALLIKGAARYVLQNFHPADALKPSYRHKQPFSAAEMEAFRVQASRFCSTCFTRT